MNIVIVKDYQELSQKSAEIVEDQILVKPDSVLGLATGSTPIGMYAELTEKYKAGLLSFENVKTFNLDEYCGLPTDNPQSYHYFMNQNLFSQVNIHPENTYLPNGNALVMEQERKAYDIKIAEAGGIDLQILGIGVDGHIGFNEPSDEFSKGTNVVELDKSTIEANSRFFEDKSQVPRTAITMGIESIMNARKILLLISGANKKEIAHLALQGEITPRVPASILQNHPDVTVIVDEDAWQLPV